MGGNAITCFLQSPVLCLSDLNIHIRDLNSAGKDEWNPKHAGLGTIKTDDSST